MSGEPFYERIELQPNMAVRDQTRQKAIDLLRKAEWWVIVADVEADGKQAVAIMADATGGELVQALKQLARGLDRAGQRFAEYDEWTEDS